MLNLVKGILKKIKYVKSKIFIVNYFIDNLLNKIFSQ
ncbi:hypothetical protein SJAV_02010 [Sulfurisphaera javensis]|uniref:Uncharacterized protein n=1 Tax=Sulfurisphaera javensis TaxID=2049879 RepID=A0AAT9GN11_9CREN